MQSDQIKRIADVNRLKARLSNIHITHDIKRLLFTKSREFGRDLFDGHHDTLYHITSLDFVLDNSC